MSVESKIIDGVLNFIANFDANGNPLEGGKKYKFHLPPNIPVRNYWSVTVYDNQTRLIIKTGQLWPSIFSSCKKLIVNQDGSVDAWFGPEAPEGRKNWVQTIPGKGWTMILRLYDPLESCFDKTWKPGEVEEVE